MMCLCALFLLSWVSMLYSVQFSHTFVSDSSRPRELQHARPPCPSPTPGVHSDSRPLCQWCHPAISSCRPLLLLPLIAPSIRVFSSESTLCMRWPKYSYIQVNQFKICQLSLCSFYNRVHWFSRLKSVVLSPAVGPLGLVIQLCLTLCHPMDCSLPGSSVHGIFQAGILGWVAISSSSR